MRLTGGEARGRRLRSLRGMRLRPTSDRVREALFDILGDRVRGSSFLDAFAGTGAVGIEALSRGAGRVVFLERDRRACRLIGDNLAVGAWQGAHEILSGDVADSLPVLAGRAVTFSIAFADPPYDAPLPAGVWLAIARVLAPGGWLVVEHRRNAPPAAPVGTALGPGRTYRYGDTALTLLHAAGGGVP